MIRPRRAFGLQVDAHTVGGTEGSIGRTIAVETHVIQSPFLALGEDAQPFLFVCRRVAGHGEAAVLHRAAQEHRPSVDVELTVADADLSQAEEGLILVVTGAYREQIKIGMELVPGLEGLCIVEPEIEHYLVFCEKHLCRAHNQIPRFAVDYRAYAGLDVEVVEGHHTHGRDVILDVDQHLE